MCCHFLTVDTDSGPPRRSPVDSDRPAADGSSPLATTCGTKRRAWSAARSTPKAKNCPGDRAPPRSAAAQTSTAACRRRRKTPPMVSAVSTSIACLSNRTSSEISSQKRLQAAPPAHTCGKPWTSDIPKAGSPGWRSAQRRSQGIVAAVEDARTERVTAPPFDGAERRR
jgi:hypothetical protein